MTIEFAINYIPARMAELGYAEYITEFRHLLLKPQEKREINAANEIYFLVESPEQITVGSEMGVYDVTDDTLNELKYEHKGIISITNTVDAISSVRFIQVIPKNQV